jgi:hypothetical protein
MGVGSQRHGPAVLRPEITQYLPYMRLGGPQDRSGWVQKISPTPEFDPLTVQPRSESLCRLRFADQSL